MTIDVLWTNPHISEQMLRYHLDPTVDVSSRRPETVDATVAWTTQLFSLGPGASVLDLGCGPGLYTGRWATTGADVTGVDFSPRSIAYARGAAARDGLRVRYVLGDYLAWQPDRTFDLITMIMCDFSALSPAQAATLLRSVTSWLAPGGAFLFDVVAAPYLASRVEGTDREEHPTGGFWSAGPYAETRETFLYEMEQIALDRYTIEEPERTWTVWNWLQAYTPSTLAQLVEAAGLTDDAVLGDVAGRPYDPAAPEFACLARGATG